MKNKNNKGFTLVEVIAVVIILGITLTTAIVGYTKYIRKAKLDYYQKQEDLVTQAGRDYFNDNRGRLPINIGEESCVTLKTLIDYRYISNVLNYDKKACNQDKSKVCAHKIDLDKYKYVTILSCGEDYNEKTYQEPTINFKIKEANKENAELLNFNSDVTIGLKKNTRFVVQMTIEQKKDESDKTYDLTSYDYVIHEISGGKDTPVLTKKNVLIPSGNTKYTVDIKLNKTGKYYIEAIAFNEKHRNKVEKSGKIELKFDRIVCNGAVEFEGGTTKWTNQDITNTITNVDEYTKYYYLNLVDSDTKEVIERIGEENKEYKIEDRDGITHTITTPENTIKKVHYEAKPYDKNDVNPTCIVKSNDYKIDKVKPVCSTTVSNNSEWTKENVEVNINCSDEGSKCRENKKKVVIKDEYIGDYVATVSDKAGNTNTCPPARIRLDKTDPVITTTSSSENDKIVLQCSDNGDVGGYYFGPSMFPTEIITNEEELNLLKTTGLTKDLLDSGNNYFTCIDKAGNYATKKINLNKEIRIYYLYNGGTVGTNSSGFTGNANGWIYNKDGDQLFHTISSGTTDDLYNHSTFALTRSGYTAKKGAEWCLSTDGTGTCFDQDAKLSYDTLRTAATDGGTYYYINLRANWKPKEIRIYYLYNGGTVGPNSSGFTGNSNGYVYNKDGDQLFHTISSGTTDLYNHGTFALTRSGYTAKKGAEWCLSTDGTGTCFDQDAKLSYDTLRTAATDGGTYYYLNLRANWKPMEIRIYYLYNGGTVGTNSSGFTGNANGYVYNKDGDQLFHTISSGTTDLYNHGTFALTRSGYTAKKGAEWCLSTDGTGTCFNQDAKLSYDTLKKSATDGGTYYYLNLRANWKLKPVYVYYHVNGGTPGGAFKKIDNFISTDGKSYFYYSFTNDTSLHKIETFGLTRTGYTKVSAKEWCTGGNGTGTCFNENTNYSFSKYRDLATDQGTYYRLIVYANWKQNSTPTTTYYTCKFKVKYCVISPDAYYAWFSWDNGASGGNCITADYNTGHCTVGTVLGKSISNYSGFSTCSRIGSGFQFVGDVSDTTGHCKCQAPTEFYYDYTYNNLGNNLPKDCSYPPGCELVECYKQ